MISKRDPAKGVFCSFFKAPQGWGGVIASTKGVLEVILPFGAMTRKGLASQISLLYPAANKGNDVSEVAAKELEVYFKGEARRFSVPLDLSECTEFQRAIYRVVAAIPYGEVKSYAEVATLIGKSGAARGVGSAMARNPIPIIIPCHRVVGSSGKMVGYSGIGGVDSKQWLLAMEQGRKGQKH
jgi:methylated-DNA-[protein]-cysteine S-methyltransferase